MFPHAWPLELVLIGSIPSPWPQLLSEAVYTLGFPHPPSTWPQGAETLLEYPVWVASKHLAS